tara:strand:+ start:549 stop:887 length:339 start_codon:yes stop_codon:yes gene_type:complete
MNEEVNTQETVEPAIKRKLELDIDVSPQYLSDNPFQKWIHLAKTVDAWRIFPRVFVSVYIILLYKVVTWFMDIPEPNLEQAGLVSIVVGAMAAVFGIYAGTSGQSKKFKGED